MAAPLPHPEPAESDGHPDVPIDEDVIEDVPPWLGAEPFAGDATDRTVGLRVRLAAKRVVITLVGVIVILAGVAMLFLPGQGILTIIAGLAILGTEYAWARRAYTWAKERSKAAYASAKQRVRAHRAEREERDHRTDDDAEPPRRA